MDNADLEKLSVDQLGLTPNFHKDITDYRIIVASNIETIKISTLASDTGASTSIKSASTGWADMGELKLNEGENKITIEVTSEDGTIKKYILDCTRLSAANATLKGLSFNLLKLKPEFESGVYDYEALVDFKQLESSLQYDVYDPDCVVKVSCNTYDIDKSADSNSYSFDLNYGFTEVCVNVTSPDKSTRQDYKIQIIRESLPRLSTFADLKNQESNEDPISLSPVYCAFKINKTGYSLPFIKFFQKISSSDPLNEISLSCEESQFASESVLFNHIKFENSVANLGAKIPLINGGFSSESKLNKISQIMEEINQSDLLNISDEVMNYKPPEDIKPVETLPAFEVILKEYFK